MSGEGGIPRLAREPEFLGPRMASAARRSHGRDTTTTVGCSLGLWRYSWNDVIVVRGSVEWVWHDVFTTRWMRPPQTHLMSRPARPRIRNGPGRGSRAKIDPQTHPTRTSDRSMSWSRHRSTHSPHPMPRRGRGAQSCGDTVTLDVVSGATGGHDRHSKRRRPCETARGSRWVRRSSATTLVFGSPSRCPQGAGQRTDTASVIAIAIAGIGVPALLVGGEFDAP